jgi:glycosyltransferase involved in cell wall biosynthesis
MGGTVISSTENALIEGLATTARHAESPLVSVIVSTYRHANWLADTVDALLAQDLEAELQVIVCDDASPDATPAVMQASLVKAERTTYAGPRSLTYVRLKRNRGPAVGRNVGLDLAAGSFLAFTDSDCIPAPGWLRSALAAIESDVGVVQGRTRAETGPAPLFEHHIDISRLDGTFATANVLYRREALAGLRFDPACWSPAWTMEDADLGWRVIAAGWQARFAEDALVIHRVIPLSARGWLAWPTRLRVFPALAARYPAFRQHLWLGFWVGPMHLWFELALIGLLLAPWWPPALTLTLPYLVEFLRTRGLRGRFPPAKIAAHLARDSVSFATLAAFSLRHRALVL